MTDPQENKRSTYLAVFKILNADTHKTIWQDDADFTALVTQFENYITDINTIRAIQEQDNTGIALLKADVRARLTNALVKVINGVVAHAIYTDNVELQNTVNYSIGDLQTSRDSILADKAGVVYDTAWPIRAALVTRRIPEADITLIDTLKQQFLQLIPEPRTGIIETSTATDDLQNKFKQTDDLLNLKLDKTILIYRPEFPDFITKYFKARSIVDYGVRHTSIKSGYITGTVLDSITKLPLPNATVSIIGTKRTVKTDADGKFSFLFRKKGTPSLQVEFDGKKLYKGEPTTILPGDQINLNIELEPNE
jgi:hypothetical protein